MSFPNQAMNSTDLAGSLITYIWDMYIPAFRARGFPYQKILNVGSTIMNTGQAVKVDIAQAMPSNVLSDGGTRVLVDEPPLVADCVLNTDRTVFFALTAVVEAFIAGQATLPAIAAGAIAGLLNDFESDIINNLILGLPSANYVGSYGVNLTTTNFIQAYSVLVQNYMPQENYYALLAPSPGAFDQFAQVNTVVFAQERRNGSGFIEESMVVGAAERFDQDIVWMGGKWSNSQLIGQVAASGSEAVTSLAFHPAALLVAARHLPLPMPGSGAVAENKFDAKTGVPIQMIYQWNLNTQSAEMGLKILYGLTPGQSAWSCGLRSN